MQATKLKILFVQVYRVTASCSHDLLVIPKYAAETALQGPYSYHATGLKQTIKFFGSVLMLNMAPRKHPIKQHQITDLPGPTQSYCICSYMRRTMLLSISTLPPRQAMGRMGVMTFDPLAASASSLQGLISSLSLSTL